MQTSRKHLLIGTATALLACGALALVLFSRIGPWSVGGPDGLTHFQALEDFHVTSRVEKRYSTLYRLEKGDLVIRIDAIPGVDGEAADVFAEQGRLSTLALYGNALSPYPGDITRKIVPDKKYQPTYVQRPPEDKTYTYFFLFANARLGYGAVVADNVKFRSLLGWVHIDRLDTLYKVRIYAPLHRENRDLQELFLALEAS